MIPASGWDGATPPKSYRKKYVYVHGKLIESARAILGYARLYTKKNGRPAILRQEFINTEKKFAELSALDIENMLYIYHKDILNACKIKDK